MHVGSLCGRVFWCVSSWEGVVQQEAKNGKIALMMFWPLASKRCFIIRRASSRRLFSHARFALRDTAGKKSTFLDKEEVRVGIIERRDPSLAAFTAPRYVNTLLGRLCFLLDSVTRPPPLRVGGVRTGSSSFSGAGKREQNRQGQTQFLPCCLQQLKGLARRPQRHFQV